MTSKRDQEHYNRWCVVDTEPIMRLGVMVHHIYCSFADEAQAKMAAMEMNHLVRPRGETMGQQGTYRTRVTTIHYRFPGEA
jgi:hypothetical protein